MVIFLELAFNRILPSLLFNKPVSITHPPILPTLALIEPEVYNPALDADTTVLEASVFISNLPAVILTCSAASSPIKVVAPNSATVVPPVTTSTPADFTLT